MRLKDLGHLFAVGCGLALHEEGMDVVVKVPREVAMSDGKQDCEQ